MVKIKKDRVNKIGKIIIKKLGPKAYKNEMLIYSKKLSYTPKLISHNPKTHTIKISVECCKSLSKLSLKDREKYHPQLKKLFRQFKRDTGYYHGDFWYGNILVNEKTGKLTLIDFEFISKTKKGLVEGLAPSVVKRRWALLKKLGINP